MDEVNLAVGGMGMLRVDEVGLIVMGDRGVRRGWGSGVRWK